MGIKYLEVENLLFNDKGAIFDGQFHSNRDAVLELVRELLCVWGRFKTAEQFISGFLLKDVYGNITGAANIAAVRTTLLTEFRKHTDLIQGFTDKLVAAFAAEKGGKPLADWNTELASFFTKLSVRGYPTVSTMSTIADWIQAMSITGIMHGGTLSFTRLICTAPILGKINPLKDVFEGNDISQLRLVSGTIVSVDISLHCSAFVTVIFRFCFAHQVGMIKEHHVFSDKLQAGMIFNRPVSAEVRAVLIEYNGLTSGLKTAYLAALKADPENFRRNGWILSDYCPDGVDGKQLTLCTYI